MGPGADLDLLSERFKATGSDYSPAFLQRYLEKNPDADVLELDTATIAINRRFHAIYSNKVLHCLAPETLTQSLLRQLQILESSGIVLHSFWYGSGAEEHAGLKTYNYSEADLVSIFPKAFEMLEIERYTEMDNDDSIFVLARLSSVT